MKKINPIGYGGKANTTDIITAGLLMYFTEAEVQQLLELLTTQLSKAHLFFDVVHSFFVNKKISSTFQWGLDKPRI